MHLIRQAVRQSQGASLYRNIRAEHGVAVRRESRYQTYTDAS